MDKDETTKIFRHNIAGELINKTIFLEEKVKGTIILGFEGIAQKWIVEL